MYTGNTCDDANDELGCIFSLNLLVPDVSEEEIIIALSDAGISFSPSATEDIGSSVDVVPATSSASVASASNAASGNLQTFAGACMSTHLVPILPLLTTHVRW